MVRSSGLCAAALLVECARMEGRLRGCRVSAVLGFVEAPKAAGLYEREEELASSDVARLCNIHIARGSMPEYIWLLE